MEEEQAAAVAPTSPLPPHLVLKLEMNVFFPLMLNVGVGKLALDLSKCGIPFEICSKIILYS